MFTRIANIVLWLGVFSGIIGSIILGVIIGTGTDKAAVGFLVVIAGWISTLLLFTLFGLIVEMANNISKSRNLLEMLCDKSFSSDTKKLDEDDSKTSMQSILSKLCELISLDKKEPSISPEQKLMEERNVWLCPRCNTENNLNEIFCSKCQEPKPKSAEYWICPNCKTRNNSIFKFCKSCHTMRKGAIPAEIKFEKKTEQPQNYWFCSACGTKNDNVRPYCIVCGVQRKGLNSSSAPPMPKNDWKCSGCGQMNDQFSYICKKCGRSKY